MRQIIDLPIRHKRFQLIILSIIILSFNGCALFKGIQEKPAPAPAPTEVKIEEKKIEIPLVEKIEQNKFPVAKGDDVVGQLAYIKLDKGDTLPDIARHFGLGNNGISKANPGVDTWAPKAGERIVLPLSFILPDAPRNGIVINLAVMRLFQFKNEGDSLKVLTYPIGVGTTERPTPQGQMRVDRKTVKPVWHVPASIAKDHKKKGDPLPATVLPGPLNPLGEYALYLSKSTYLVHGTNKPASIGLRATNGCIRLYPEDIKRLYEDTPVKTPVSIVNQPYLVGTYNGSVYLEVHEPLEDFDASNALEKINAKLKKIEKESGQALDWGKIKNVITEAKGIPVPVSVANDKDLKTLTENIELKHPDKLFGKPEVPELITNAWYVSAANVQDEIDAVRLAAIINHQGPPIPARVLSKTNGYSVIAGPFKDIMEAKEAIRRLKIDLELDGLLIKPDESK
jgi:L,D-transpeptidase ErfK/SrfK